MAGGRESKHTPEREARLLAGYSETGSGNVACARAGISRTTLSRWREADPTLQERIDEALGVWEDSLLQHITVAAVKSWQAAAWLLERRWPERFGQRQRIEHSTPPGEALNVKHDLTDDARAALDLVLRAMRTSGDGGTTGSPPPGVGS